MSIRGFFQQLNIPAQCKKYGVPLWQCPSFLFLIMGALITLSSIVTYALGARYFEDIIAILIVLVLTAILFVLSYAIVSSFERLAEANRLKLEFVRIVSHQLRSPITNLKWAIDILMSGDLGKIEEKQTEYFKILKENSSRMSDLVNDLLVVARLEEGSFEPKKEKIFLEKIINNLILRFKALALALNVKIEFECGELPEIFSDPNQIEIVIENLLDNAIRYIKGKGEVKIKLERRNKKVYFEIKDNGVGIPEEEKKYIFQKFFRGKDATEQQTLGTGLGLYIAKAITERFSGKIGFQSEKGKGSVFWFTLPLK